MERFLNWLADNWLEVSVAASWVVQISPIKINPWTSLLKWLGNVINAGTEKKIEEMQESFDKKLAEIRDHFSKELAEVKRQLEAQMISMDENEKDRIRNEVLSFATSCRRGIHHTKDEFDHIITIHRKYEALLKKTGDENGVFTEEYDFILEIYHECQRENKFV